MKNIRQYIEDTNTVGGTHAALARLFPEGARGARPRPAEETTPSETAESGQRPSSPNVAEDCAHGRGGRGHPIRPRRAWGGGHVRGGRNGDETCRCRDREEHAAGRHRADGTHVVLSGQGASGLRTTARDAPHVGRDLRG